MGEWHTYTPDGRELFVSDQRDEWTVRCGTAVARSRVLDVALIEAIRGDADFFVGTRRGKYAEWVRAQAERIERERAVG